MVSLARLKGSVESLRRCLAMVDLSRVCPEEGNLTGSSISVHVMGSAKEKVCHKGLLRFFLLHTTASICVCVCVCVCCMRSMCVRCVCVVKERDTYPKIRLGFLPALVHLLSLGSGRRRLP